MTVAQNQSTAPHSFAGPNPVPSSDGDALLEIQNLRVHFFLEEGLVRAVDGASFDVRRGETLGGVGESGCGKSVTGQAILRITPSPGRIVGGEIVYHRGRGNDVSKLTEDILLTNLDPHGARIRSIRGAEIAMIFQEPMTSFSPVHTIGDQIGEVFILHQGATRAEAREKSAEMLKRVGLPRAEQTLDRYPHQLSGGMRQRAMIAMALSCRPSLLIADEPTTALDVTTQAVILDLMRQLQSEMGMAIMFITHNLGVIAEMTTRAVVMYLGKVVEMADTDSLFYDPKHPYTQALLRSIPLLGDKSRQRLESIQGNVPDPYNIPSGCPFHPRCRSFRTGVCDKVEPDYITVAPGHEVRCVLYT
jgi:oligopeptide/dipeptide ABC transporter ATP-binding protein